MLVALPMRWFRAALLTATAGLGCDVGRSSQRDRPPPALPRIALEDIPPASLCITKGELAGARVEGPTFRAIVPGHGGEAASLKFVVLGSTAQARALASGDLRRQLGLKLRAEDGCNLVYVMWRLDPKPKVEVSVKRNPGARTSRDCGARGYAKLAPTGARATPVGLDDGAEHELRAEIGGDALVAWIDGRVMWRGTLPADVRKLSGPAGVRADNLAFEIAGIAVDARTGGDVDAKCRAHDDAE